MTNHLLDVMRAIPAPGKRMNNTTGEFQTIVRNDAAEACALDELIRSLVQTKAKSADFNSLDFGVLPGDRGSWVSAKGESGALGKYLFRRTEEGYIAPQPGAWFIELVSRARGYRIEPSSALGGLYRLSLDK